MRQAAKNPTALENRRDACNLEPPDGASPHYLAFLQASQDSHKPSAQRDARLP
jgi:hypothetical protein